MKWLVRYSDAWAGCVRDIQKTKSAASSLFLKKNEALRYALNATSGIEAKEFQTVQSNSEDISAPGNW
jgi:hypothetical protein